MRLQTRLQTRLDENLLSEGTFWHARIIIQIVFQSSLHSGNLWMIIQVVHNRPTSMVFQGTRMIPLAMSKLDVLLGDVSRQARHFC
jgi:hypothetical protein